MGKLSYSSSSRGATQHFSRRRRHHHRRGAYFFEHWRERRLAKSAEREKINRKGLRKRFPSRRRVISNDVCVPVHTESKGTFVGARTEKLCQDLRNLLNSSRIMHEIETKAFHRFNNLLLLFRDREMHAHTFAACGCVRICAAHVRPL